MTRGKWGERLEWFASANRTHPRKVDLGWPPVDESFMGP